MIIVKPKLTSLGWLLMVWLWLGSSAAFAQADSLLYQADRLLSWKAYGRAIELYNDLLTEPGVARLTPKQASQAKVGLALAYQQVGDNVKAEKAYLTWLAQTPAPTPTPRQALLYAQILAGNGKFQESQRAYDAYLTVQANQKPKPRPTANRNLPDAGQPPTRYRLELLALNTNKEEFSPAFYGDGLVYVAGDKGSTAIETTGKGGGAGYLDLLFAPNRNQLTASRIINADGTEVKPKPQPNQPFAERSVGSDDESRPTANDSRTVPAFAAGISVVTGLGYESRPPVMAREFSRSLNTRYHEGPATFSRDGSEVIFTRNNFNGGKAGKSTDGTNKLKLYTARQQDGSFTVPQELSVNSDEYSVGHPTLSKDGQRLIFASDMPGGFGGTDLYVTTRADSGSWSKPVNLGSVVNTEADELFPFVDEGNNLYFASNGRPGQGGLDIYFMPMTASGQPAGSVETLPAPLNSPKDDFGLITDGTRSGGYFSSNRRNDSDDIYRFVRESSLYSCRDLTVRFYDADTDLPLDSVTVSVKGRSEGRPDQQLLTDSTGYVQLCLEADNDFLFEGARDGYINSRIGFSTRLLTDDEPSRLEVSLSKPTMVYDTIAAAPPTANLPAKSLTTSRIRGQVVSQRDRRPIEGVLVRLRNECTGKILETSTNADGQYFFDLIEGCDYTLVASKETWGTNTRTIRKLPKKTKPKELSADLSLFKVGDAITIDNIYYDLGSYNLRADASRELDKIVATMQKNPSLAIEVRSHTDSRGDAAVNKALATRRAKSVATYLASKGIGRRRIAATGVGEAELINNCTDGVICTEAEHQRNRRTEFRVVAVK